MRKQIQRYIDNKVNPLEHPIPLPEFVPPSPRPPYGAAAFPQLEMEPAEKRIMPTPAEPNPLSTLNAATPGNLLPPSPVTELFSKLESQWSREEKWVLMEMSKTKTLLNKAAKFLTTLFYHHCEHKRNVAKHKLLNQKHNFMRKNAFTANELQYMNEQI